MKDTIKALRQYIKQMQPANGESVLKMLYEYHSEHQPYDNEQIKADFKALYRQMNGMSLQEMDKIIYPVCTLCRDHELAGFIEGVKMGVRLARELI
jgi:hypothetical protein